MSLCVGRTSGLDRPIPAPGPERFGPAPGKGRTRQLHRHRMKNPRECSSWRYSRVSKRPTGILRAPRHPRLARPHECYRPRRLSLNLAAFRPGPPGACGPETPSGPRLDDGCCKATDRIRFVDTPLCGVCSG
jgi:hypothetical protein